MPLQPSAAQLRVAPSAVSPSASISSTPSLSAAVPHRLPACPRLCRRSFSHPPDALHAKRTKSRTHSPPSFPPSWRMCLALAFAHASPAHDPQAHQLPRAPALQPTPSTRLRLASLLTLSPLAHGPQAHQVPRVPAVRPVGRHAPRRLRLPRGLLGTGACPAAQDASPRPCCRRGCCAPAGGRGSGGALSPAVSHQPRRTGPRCLQPSPARPTLLPAGARGQHQPAGRGAGDVGCRFRHLDRRPDAGHG